MKERYLQSAIEILKKIHYITIATVCDDGSPWNSPVSASFDAELNFFWGSSPDNTHSRNIRHNGKVFVVIFDSTVPEGTGEGLYLKGETTELDFEFGEVIKKYRFTPEQIWINDEVKNDDGSYKHDVRVELNLEDLKKAMVT